jgi:subtilisin-like proprotein convertase family protein
MQSPLNTILPALALLAAGSGAFAADCCNRRAQKSTVIVPGSMPHRSLPAGDSDRVRFEVVAPSRLVVATTGPVDGDTVLDLHGPDDAGAHLANNDNADDSTGWSRIDLALVQPGTYHLTVRNNGAAIEDYALELTIVPLAAQAKTAGAPAAARATPRPLLPDLKPIADEDLGYMHGWELDQTTFPGNTILRLSTAIANLGAGAMEIRGTTAHADGTQDVVQRIYNSDGSYSERLAGIFRYHPLHEHVHFDGFAVYNLRPRLHGGGAGPVLRGGSKTSFCLMDVVEYDLGLPGAPTDQVYAECATYQGVSVGWNDLYVKSLPDQWIDVTGLDDARYWLEVVADPENLLAETDETNNTTRIGVDLHIPRAVIAGRVYDDRNGNGVLDADDTGIAGQRVYLDLNGNGRFDNAAVSRASEDVPKVVKPESRCYSDLLVSEVGGRIADLDLKLRITHPDVSRLGVTLISPTGRRVPLASGLPAGANLTNTVFDDQAATGIRSGSAPFTARFRPVTPLGELAGGNPNGRWQLEITTASGGATGSLVSWSLAIGTTETSVISGADGRYVFRGLPVLPYQVRIAPAAGWRATAPVTGVYPVTPSDGMFAGDRDFGVTAATLISGQVYHDLDGDGVKETGEGGIPGVRVWLDLDGDHAFDSGPVALPSSDVPRLLPDLGQASSLIPIAGRSGFIAKLRVKVSMTHTYLPDVSLWLVGPDGTRVQLVDHVDWEGEDFAGAIFDDAAAQPVREAHPPVTGAFRPEEPLAAFVGKPLIGTWTLEMADNEQADFGTLTAWSLLIDYSEPTRITDAGGEYSFADQPPGTYAVRHAVPAGFAGVSPASGVHTVTLAAGAAATGRDFGDARGGSIAGGVIELGSASGGCCGDGGGLSGWTVWLDLDQDGVKDAGEPTATSAADGSFAFTGLKPGTYRVREVVKAGWTLATPVSGYRVVTLASGQSASGVCFANRH